MIHAPHWSGPVSPVVEVSVPPSSVTSLSPLTVCEPELVTVAPLLITKLVMVEKPLPRMFEAPKSMVPPLLTVNVRVPLEVPKAPAAVPFKVPPLTAMVPENELLAEERVMVPAPSLVMPPLPPTGVLIVTLPAVVPTVMPPLVARLPPASV